MPNYDIIPLAADLMDYTIQRVKAKEPDYIPVRAYAAPGGTETEMTLYERTKPDGKPHFPKSQTFHLCKLLEDCAAKILEKCISADGRYFETEYRERLNDLNEVLVTCSVMQQYINLAYKRKYISGDQCAYWGELLRPIRQKAFAWRRNDSNRAAALHDAKAAQEIANNAELVRQIGNSL